MKKSTPLLFKLVFLFLFVFSPFLSLANGGPIDESYLYSTGHIKLKTEAEFDLVDEKLNVRFTHEWCEVEVTYSIYNKGDARSIAYGFPVSILDAEDMMSGDSVIHQNYIKDFSISVDGQAIGHTTKPGAKRQHDDETAAALGWEDVLDVWYVSKMDVPGKSTFKIKVTYKVKPMYTDWATSKDPLPSFGYRVFRYDLSPAASWGKGYIGQFTMNLDFSPIMEYDPVLIFRDAPGLQVPEEGRVTFVKSNYYLTEESQMTVEYDYDLLKLHIDKTSLNDKISSIEATSTLSDYPVNNLLDNDSNTAWVEGEDGLGIGESILIEFDSPVSPTALGMAFGYQKSRDLFQANGSPTKIKLTLYNGDKTHESEIDASWFAREANIENKYYRYNWVEVYSDLEEIDKIRITILEAKAGTKYKDVCISDIIFLDQW